jgi:hypothetical protein
MPAQDQMQELIAMEMRCHNLSIELAVDLLRQMFDFTLDHAGGSTVKRLCGLFIGVCADQFPAKLPVLDELIKAKEKEMQGGGMEGMG